MARGRKPKETAPETLEIVEMSDETQELASPEEEEDAPEIFELEPEVIQVEEKLVAVYPLVDLNGVLVGRQTYNLQKGVKLMVPPGVRDHLKEKGKI